MFSIWIKDMLHSRRNKMTEQPEKIRTWYGLTGTVIIDDGLFHRSGFGKMVILHPGLVNWLLRQQLSKADRKMLTYRHEWGHLQTVPIFLIYLLLLIALQWESLNWLFIIAIVVVSQALWELVSELSVFMKLRKSYVNIYRNKLMNPIIFGLIMMGLNWIYWWKILTGFETLAKI